MGLPAIGKAAVMSEKGPTFRRAQSHQDRDSYVEKHRTPPAGTVVDFVAEDVTGQYQGAELARIRSRRPTPERIARLEAKHDQLASIVTEMRVDVADIRGDQKAQNASLTSISKTLDRLAEREAVDHAADADVDAARQKDLIAAAKAKREAIIKVVLYVVTGGLLGKIMHTLGLL